MSCRFYGKNGMFGQLIDQGGNECGLILTSYSPCPMEMDGSTPDENTCSVASRARQIHKLIELSQTLPVEAGLKA